MSVVGPVSACATAGSLLGWGVAELADTSGTPRLDAELLLAHAAGIRRSAAIAFPEHIVADAARDRFARLIDLRRDEVPMAYLLGVREFYSLPLKVTPAVLVPRPETEHLVEAALELIAGDAAASVLDLGTGSGAIALAIKHARPQALVTAVDCSADALGVARVNAAALGLDVALVEADWHDGLEDRRFDLVVTNPPYVGSGDPALAGALRHEPAVALDGGADGLDAIRAIVAGAPACLEPGGHLIIEHGDRQAQAVGTLARAQGLIEIRTLRDLAGRDRALIARRP